MPYSASASSSVLVAAAIRLPSHVELNLDNVQTYAAQVLRSLAALVKAAVTALAASLATERRTLARLIPVSLKGVYVVRRIKACQPPIWGPSPWLMRPWLGMSRSVDVNEWSPTTSRATHTVMRAVTAANTARWQTMCSPVYQKARMESEPPAITRLNAQQAWRALD